MKDTSVISLPVVFEVWTDADMLCLTFQSSGRVLHDSVAFFSVWYDIVLQLCGSCDGSAVFFTHMFLEFLPA
jgi:hypothetical protein